MNEWFSYIKESVRLKKVYHLPEVDYQIKLNQNENPYDLPEKLKFQILSQIESQNWNRYPTLGSAKLREEIGKTLGFSTENIMVGNGSNEIMLAIMMTLLEPEKKMITISPTFSLYKHYGEIFGAFVDVVPLKEKFQFPISDICEKVHQKNVSLTVLCSPNNPTGNCISGDDLIKILKFARGFVLVDEAYFDFCQQDFANLIQKHPNLILTRTFSKACAFSFGRFGYGISSPEYVNEVYKVLLPYNLSGFSEQAASNFIRNRELLEPITQQIIQQREIIFSELKKMKGVNPFPSDANFILIQPEKESNLIFEKLIEKKILVRDVSYYPGLGNHLRISVGTPEENEKLLETLNEIMN